MLSVGPWHRLPLTIRWLKQDYEQYYPATMPPPVHMPMLYGAFEMTKEGISHKVYIQDIGEGKMLCQLCGREKIVSSSGVSFFGNNHNTIISISIGKYLCLFSPSLLP